MGSQSGAIVTVAAAARAILAIAASLQSVYGQSCGGSLTGSGTFSSPNYPGNYPNGLNCQWVLTSSDGNSAVQLFFSDIIVENHFDYMEIYSGGILMEKYQEYTPAHSAVYSRSVTINFRTDGSVSAGGFQIFFNSTSPTCGMSCVFRRCATWTPNFPFPFPKGASCQWTIATYASPLFVANSGFLAIESTTVSPVPFTGTFVIARDFANGSQPVDTYRSPARIPPVTLGEQLVDVAFTSDRCFSGTGFMLSFTQLTTQCGEELVGNGTFSTPNYPNGYAPLTICVWRLTALAGMRVQLTVVDMFVEAGFDFVRIYSDDQLVNSQTGTQGTFTLTLGSQVIVDFQSDQRTQRNGMRASFISVP